MRTSHVLAYDCDYKAAAVYTRSAFEKLVREYCARKKKSLVFKPKLKDYSSENFWDKTKADVPGPVYDIERRYDFVAIINTM